MKSLHDFLHEVPDHRRAQGTRTPIGAFLEMIVLAGMSGHIQIRPLSRFITNNATYFNDRYNLQHGTPSYATIRNFFKGLDFTELTKAFTNWSSQFLEPNEWISIDGKVIGSTVTDCHNTKQNYESMVSAFCSKNEIVLEVVSISNKEDHEGAAARRIIEQFENKGVTFTMDALHCQKKQRKPSWSQEMSTSFK